jgi:hypothetical protein
MIGLRIALTGLLLAWFGPTVFAQNQDPPEVDEAAEERLDAPVTLHFPEPTPLGVVLDAIRKEAGKDLTVAVDNPALSKAGISDDAKIQIDVEGVPLKAALTQVVRQAKLIYKVEKSKATITVDPYQDPDPKVLDAEMKAVDTTVYAPKYDEQGFRSIEEGMTEVEVHKLVGKPIREARAKPEIEWYYGPPTLRVTLDGGMFDTSGLFQTAWGYTIVRASPEGKIEDILGGYFPDIPKELIGADLSEMKKRFGEPNAVRTIKATRYLIYSGSKSNGSFRTRAVGLGKDSKVVEVVAGYYFEDEPE